MNKQQSLKKGFTLIELLIVIAILALLMSIIVVALNPAEMLRKSRDTKRVADLDSLRTALNLYLTDKSSPSLGASNSAYYSLPGSTMGANGDGKTTVLVSSANLRNVDGTGWVPVNFASISSGSPLAALPADPSNATSTTASSNLYYTYACSTSTATFEINARMESTYYKDGGDGDVCSKDGGNTTVLYEVGSEPGLDLMGTTSSYFYQWP